MLRLVGLMLCMFVLAGAARAGLPPDTAESDILPVEQAFELAPALWDGRELSLSFKIAPGCYLYRERMFFEAVEPANYALGFAALPLGETHEDAHFGKVAVFRNSVEVRFRPKSAVPPKSVRVRYQGCAQDKVCYPSQTRVLTVKSLPTNPP